MSIEADKILNIDSLARGDSHMVARFLDTWNAAREERATWPLPWDDDYETREVRMDRHRAATLLLGVLAGTWTRHLLRKAGVKDGDLPPPTSSQQRKLVRLLNTELGSDDDGRQVLAYWAKGLLSGRTEQVQHEFERLAGDMDLGILTSIVNHVRRTSAQFNGHDLTFIEKPAQPEVAGE